MPRVTREFNQQPELGHSGTGWLAIEIGPIARNLKRYDKTLYHGKKKEVFAILDTSFSNKKMIVLVNIDTDTVDYQVCNTFIRWYQDAIELGMSLHSKRDSTSEDVIEKVRADIVDIKKQLVQKEEMIEYLKEYPGSLS